MRTNDPIARNTSQASLLSDRSSLAQGQESRTEGGESKHVTSRREFMSRAALCSGMTGVLLAGAAKLAANPLGLPIGSQVLAGAFDAEGLSRVFVKQMAALGVTRLGVVLRLSGMARV